jgi:tetraacyldisaccharide 4'-kinase
MLKKPKFWDEKKVTIFSIILYPFSLIVILRNFLSKFLKKEKFKIKSICVGNIYLGGTGKTPLTIKLFNLLKKNNFKVATAKKYYKVHKDEELILKKNSDLITGTNRKKIFLKAIKKKIDLLIFDDGLQDLNIDYDLKFVCFKSDVFFGNGLVLPAGPLRECLSNIKKYDAIFINGNKNYSSNVKKIKDLSTKIKIFKTYYKIKSSKKLDKSGKYFLFSGIGDSKSFRKIILDNGLKIVKEKIFSDHHDYSNKEIKEIIGEAETFKAKIITTEKDFVKIPLIYRKKIKPIKISLKIEGQKKLINFIKKKIYEKN